MDHAGQRWRPASTQRWPRLLSWEMSGEWRQCQKHAWEQGGWRMWNTAGVMVVMDPVGQHRRNHSTRCWLCGLWLRWQWMKQGNSGDMISPSVGLGSWIGQCWITQQNNRWANGSWGVGLGTTVHWLWYHPVCSCYISSIASLELCIFVWSCLSLTEGTWSATTLGPQWYVLSTEWYYNGKQRTVHSYYCHLFQSPSHMHITNNSCGDKLFVFELKLQTHAQIAQTHACIPQMHNNYYVMQTNCFELILHSQSNILLSKHDVICLMTNHMFGIA